MSLSALKISKNPSSRRSTPRTGVKGSVRPRNSSFKKGSSGRLGLVDAEKSSQKSGGEDDSPFLIRKRYPGLDGVLDEMKKLVKEYKGHPEIRDWAVKITQNIDKDIRTGLPNRRDYQAIAEAVYSWMKKNVAYVRDPDEIEWLQSPVKTLEKRKGLQYGYGDCDDQSIAAAALMSSIGIPTRFKVVKSNPNKRDVYSHVYLEYKANGEWKPFDPTLHSKAGDGLKDSQIYGSRHVDLSDGLGCAECGGNSGLADIIPGANWNLIGIILLGSAFGLAYWQKRNCKT